VIDNDKYNVAADIFARKKSFDEIGINLKYSISFFEPNKASTFERILKLVKIIKNE
jgi:hypothetical protein